MIYNPGQLRGKYNFEVFFMKNSIKLLALLLALASLLAVLAGCGETENETETQSETNQTEQTTVIEQTTEPEALPPFEKKNYDDDLFLQVSGGIDYFWVEEGEGDVISEALYARQQKIYEYLGVEITASVAAGDHLNNYQEFMTSVKNKDGAIDMYFTNTYIGIPTLISSGYLRNLDTVDELDLEAEYWNMPYMDSLSLFGNHYLGYNDFCVPKTFMIAFNKVMMEQYGDSMEDSIYNIVNNYQWTIDRMIALANLVYADKTGDGKTVDDTFGITGEQWIPFIGFLQASNIQLVDMNEQGDYVVSVYNEINKERTTTLVDKLKALASGDSAWFKFRIEDTPTISLTTG